MHAPHHRTLLAWAVCVCGGIWVADQRTGCAHVPASGVLGVLLMPWPPLPVCMEMAVCRDMRTVWSLR